MWQCSVCGWTDPKTHTKELCVTRFQLAQVRDENRQLRKVAKRVVRANQDVEKHGYASLRRMVYALENVLREVQGCD